MTRERPTPPFLRELLGERFTLLGVASMLALGGLCATLVVVGNPPLPAWQVALAVVLLADIGAGALANFTSSTNAWYGGRPRHRWVFIAVHVHLPLVAVVLRWPLVPALVTWAWTIASACLVNLLANRPEQRVVAGGLFAFSLLIPLVAPSTPAACAVSALFTLKVAYAFAVRHEPRVAPTAT